MSPNPSFDRESFQELLANAFAVQESDIDRESLSAIIEVQRLIAKGELDADGTMHLIVECARDVAHAGGIAVAVLEGNQLVYRAGSGVASSYVGRHAIASLVVSANTDASREILRVENAETDTRIEAAICRQFGGTALVIFLIYRDRAAVGLLQVVFTQPHVFQDREVRTYRLMAGLIEDAMSRTGALEPAENVGVSLRATAPAPVAQITDRTPKSPDWLRACATPRKQARGIPGRGSRCVALARESQTRRQPAVLATMISPGDAPDSLARTLEASAGGRCCRAAAHLLVRLEPSPFRVAFESFSSARIIGVGTAGAVPAGEIAAGEKRHPGSKRRCPSVVSASPAEKGGACPDSSSAGAGEEE